MTTRAKLSTSLPQGHGIPDTDAMYQALVDGKPVRPVLALVLLEPVATAQRKTAKGLHREVTCEAIRVESVLDSNQAGELMWLLQKLYEQRTSTGAQGTLPLGGIGGDIDERRHEQMERMEAWAAQEQLTGGELETRWRAHFGIDPDKDFSYGDHGVPGDYRKAGLQQLMEFVLQEIDKPQSDEDDEEDGEDGSDLSDEAGSDDACQVCSTTDAPLTDGLCPNCAKTAGLRVAPVAEDGDARDGKSKAAGD